MLSIRKAGIRAAAAAASALLIGQAPSSSLHGQQPPQEIAANSPDNETPALWFVEMNLPPTADGTSLATVRAEKAAFRQAAARAGAQYVERFAYDTLWNGLSIRVAPASIGAVARVPGVRAIYPVMPVSVEPRAPDAEIDLITALAMTGADVAQNALGLTGAGVRVAVMDTGIDYDHPDLGGCFGPGCRVEMGYDFVGDAFNNGSVATPTPDPDPDDCNGHGTHVAGIVGANGAVKGVAPGVTLHAYRVFGCEGTTTDDILLAAMERVLADGAEVLNMSLGASFAWPQYPTAQAADRLVNKGISVVAAMGNAGTSGLYAGDTPAFGQKVIGVASFDNTHVTMPAFSITPDGMLMGYFAADGAPAPPTAGTFPMARTGTPTSPADACTPLPPGSLSGRVALIRRGTCSFYMKSKNALDAGAAGVVLYNNVAGFLGITVAGSPPITIPVVSITAAQGVLINNRLAAGPVSMTWTDQLTQVPNPTGGLISSFSSYGPAPDLSVKPDIGAPGGTVYSTLPLEQGGHGIISGTSMATPHVAGAVALLLQAHPHIPAQAVRSILQNSADPKPWWGNPALGFLDNVHRQGAGILDIDDAILAETRVEPARLALGESEAGPVTNTLTVRNEGSAEVTYALGHSAALATGPTTFTPSFLNGPASVAFSAPSVVVPPGGSATVDVTIAANAALPDKSLYGGYIVLTPEGGGAVYRVPYAGFKGDYQSIRVLTPTAAGFPWLAKLIGVSLVNQPGGATYTMAGNDIPFIAFHLDHQSRVFRMEIVDAATGKAWHRALNDEFLPRNSTATSAFVFPWDGKTTAGNKEYTVPNGSYLLKLSVLKALGDSENPAHWETWTSPTITIARP